MIPPNLIRECDINSLKIMGILNVTPDSFSDGGRFFSFDDAIAKAMQMIEEGVDIIDIGGESTRPGATPIDPLEECQRVIPVIEYLKKTVSIPLSIDTRHAVVMEAAIDAGVSMVNDVSALQGQGALEIVAAAKVPVCLMHMKGEPTSMQLQPHYENILDEIYHFFQKRIDACVNAGISKKDIWIDPGFGFGKTLAHNLTLLGNLSFFKSLGCPILVGLSRKSLFGQIIHATVDNRMIASIAGATLAAIQGACVIRTHDVAQTKEAILVVNEVKPHWLKERGNISVA